MEIKEAHEMIKNYVLEEFDDQWSTEPTFIQEFPDFFEFHINSKKYFETKQFEHLFVGLGPGFISKRHGDLIQYGSAQSYGSAARDFLLTEYKLNIVRSKYEIGRFDHHYDVTLHNISDEAKACKYLEGIKIYYWNIPEVKKIKIGQSFEFSSMDYFGLINLLYFNIMDPFGEFSYRENKLKYDHAYSSLNHHEHEDALFHEHMLSQIHKEFPAFNIDENYSATITNVYDKDRLRQCLPTAWFSYFGDCENTGITGYLPYSYEELSQMLTQENKSFEYTSGGDLFFFLYANIMTPFCNIEIEAIPVNWDGSPR